MVAKQNTNFGEIILSLKDKGGVSDTENRKAVGETVGLNHRNNINKDNQVEGELVS